MSRTTWFKGLGLITFLAGSITTAFCFFALASPRPGGNFTLQYRDKKWTFSENAKPLNLLYFGYVKCPDACPLSLSNAGRAFHSLSADDQKKVQLMFVSVDAEHDTPTSVADYAKNFFPDFIGLTGKEAEISKVVDLFGAVYIVDKDPGSYLGYSIAHTDMLFFLNKKGVVIDTIPIPRSSDQILKKIRKHL